jgi:VIT1/CCC1 family predicted Fe2+/Mn2+ transporter
MIGVAASAASKQVILLAGVAGVVAGAMSMAAGEYVSVSSQRDTELADIEIEKRELAQEPQAELNELIMIYVKRGLDRDLATKVAEQLSAHDRLAAHMRDELGIDQSALSRPMQAALTSAASFGAAALVPIVGLFVAPEVARIPVVAAVSLLSLVALGALGGRLGGASMPRAALRVAIGGTIAMCMTAAIGHLFGAR